MYQEFKEQKCTQKDERTDSDSVLGKVVHTMDIVVYNGMNAEEKQYLLIKTGIQTADVNIAEMHFASWT